MQGSVRLALPENKKKKKTKLGGRMIKQLLNSVIAKYRDLTVSRRLIICLSLRLQQIINLLATDKSRYFAQPRPITVNCHLTAMLYTFRWLVLQNVIYCFDSSHQKRTFFKVQNAESTVLQEAAHPTPQFKTTLLHK